MTKFARNVKNKTTNNISENEKATSFIAEVISGIINFLISNWSCRWLQVNKKFVS